MAANKLFTGPDDARIRRVLCLTAHPDDIEFYCAGSVRMMADRGASITFVIATSGDKGTSDEALTAEELGPMRETEQRAAAALLGADTVLFLRHPDAEVTENLDLRAEFVAAIRTAKPDLLLTFDPTPQYRQHPDHRAVGRVALDAAWPCARDRLSHPTLGPPHETPEAWLFAGPRERQDLTVDVRPVLTAKIAARLEHRSQTPNPAQLRSRWRRIAAEERFARVNLR